MEEERRNFFKKSGAAIAGLTALAVTVKETRATYAKNSWVMIIDLNRCTGCQSCVIACKAHNPSAEGLFKTRIAIGEAANGSTIKATYTPIVCKQCKSPAW